MKIVDLGNKDTPLVLFGGPYSNRHALDALLAWTDENNIRPEDCICTGDVVAYCAHPAETVANIRKFGFPVVAGNCERQLALDALNCGCGFKTGSTCDLLSARWYAHVNAAIGREDRAWMNELPDMILFTHHGLRCAVIHGGLSDISRFLWSTSADQEFQQEIDLITSHANRIDIVIAGHSGIAFKRRIGRVCWVNAGVIGMPPNNGRMQTEFAVLRAGEVSIQMLNYDHASASSDMRGVGLTQGYEETLLTGFWPSEDVLPSALRRSS